MGHTLTVNKTQTGLEGLLVFDGELTMAEAQETHQAILAAILEVSTLIIDLQSVVAVDASLIQLLCSAHRECFLSGKTIHIQSGESESISRLLDRSGYCKQFGCIPGAIASCLWPACQKATQCRN